MPHCTAPRLAPVGGRCDRDVVAGNYCGGNPTSNVLLLRSGNRAVRLGPGSWDLRYVYCPAVRVVMKPMPHLLPS